MCIDDCVLRVDISTFFRMKFPKVQFIFSSYVTFRVDPHESALSKRKNKQYFLEFYLKYKMCAMKLVSNHLNQVLERKRFSF